MRSCCSSEFHCQPSPFRLRLHSTSISVKEFSLINTSFMTSRAYTCSCLYWRQYKYLSLVFKYVSSIANTARGRHDFQRLKVAKNLFENYVYWIYFIFTTWSITLFNLESVVNTLLLGLLCWLCFYSYFLCSLHIEVS